jgi:hypothetical protein
MNFQKELQSYTTNFLSYATTGNPNNQKLYEAAQTNLETILQSTPSSPDTASLKLTHDRNETKLRRSHQDTFTWIDPSWRYWVAGTLGVVAVCLTSF